MSALRGLCLIGALLLALALSAAPAAAQSLLATWGLGVTLDPLDGRGRGLGSVGPGLFGTGVGTLALPLASARTGPTTTAVARSTFTRAPSTVIGAAAAFVETTSQNSWFASRFSISSRSWLALTLGAAPSKRARGTPDVPAVPEPKRFMWPQFTRTVKKPFCMSPM